MSEPRPSDRRTTGEARRSIQLIAGLVLLLAYLLPLFVPPGGETISAPTPEASTLERLFPGVPSWWTALRLACLLAGALLVAASVSRRFPVRVLELGTPESRRRQGPTARYVALALALASALIVPWASQLGAQAQIAYLAALFAPSLVLATASGRRRESAGHRWRRLLAAAAAPLAVLIVWCALRIPAAIHSPRAATPVDMWLNFQALLDVINAGENLLTGATQPGVSNTYLLFIGAPILGPQMPPTLTWIQAWHTAWIAATALALSCLVTTCIGRRAAAVAVATFLFSPFLMMSHLGPTPFAIPILLTLGMLLLARSFLGRRSEAALAALGALGGVAATFPHIAHLALACCAVVAVAALRRPRAQTIVLATALVSFLAAVGPTLPSAETIRAMAMEYTHRSWQWAGVEAVLLGQRSPFRAPDVMELMYAGWTKPLDLPLGGLLLPFASPRTALRLCGDSFFEPIGAALAGVGLALCLRRFRSRGARIVLAFAALAVLPTAVTTQYDRVSLTRGLAIPLAVSILAAVGFAAIERSLAPRARGVVSIGAVALIALSGWLLFERVTPRIVGASSMEIILQAMQTLPDWKDAVVLQHGGAKRTDWLNIERIATHLPLQPLAARKFEGPASLAPPEGAPSPAFLFWSPGMEEENKVSEAVCDRWPSATLYELTDRSGLSHAHGASLAKADWEPALPSSQWRRKSCAGRLGNTGAP